MARSLPVHEHFQSSIGSCSETGAYHAQEIWPWWVSAGRWNGCRKTDDLWLMRGNAVIAATETNQLEPMTTKLYGMASLESAGVIAAAQLAAR